MIQIKQDNRKKRAISAKQSIKRAVASHHKRFTENAMDSITINEGHRHSITSRQQQQIGTTGQTDKGIYVSYKMGAVHLLSCSNDNHHIVYLGNESSLRQRGIDNDRLNVIKHLLHLVLVHGIRQMREYLFLAVIVLGLKLLFDKSGGFIIRILRAIVMSKIRAEGDMFACFDLLGIQVLLVQKEDHGSLLKVLIVGDAPK